jgi:putative ATPase
VSVSATVLKLTRTCNLWSDLVRQFPTCAHTVLSCLISCHSPICSRRVPEELINQHLDANCRDTILGPSTPKKTPSARPVAPIFGATGSAEHGLFISQRTQHAPKNKLFQKRKTTGDLPRLPHTTTSIKRTRHTIGSHLQAASPLAERLRPNTLDDFVGQVHLTGPNSFLSTLAEKGATGSIILWGPPG